LPYQCTLETGVFGYFHFGEDTESNILLNYERDWATTLVFVVMISTILACFPLNVFPLRELIDQMIIGRFYPELEDAEDTFSWYVFLLL